MLATTGQGQPPPAIRLKTAAIKDAAEARGWATYREIAQGVGTSPATLCRLLRETEPQPPGPAFIAAVLQEFPEKTFEDFFEVVDSAEEAA